MMHTSRKILALTVAAALSACTTSPVTSDFGSAVRQVQAGQTLNPATRDNPSDKPVISADPYAVNAAIESMRKDVPKREDVKQDVIVNVGGQTAR